MTRDLFRATWQIPQTSFLSDIRKLDVDILIHSEIVPLLLASIWHPNDIVRFPFENPKSEGGTPPWCSFGTYVKCAATRGLLAMYGSIVHLTHVFTCENIHAYTSNQYQRTVSANLVDNLIPLPKRKACSIFQHSPGMGIGVDAK